MCISQGPAPYNPRMMLDSIDSPSSEETKGITAQLWVQGIAEIPWLILLAFLGHSQELAVDVGETDIWVSEAIMGGDADPVTFELSDCMMMILVQVGDI